MSAAGRGEGSGGLLDALLLPTSGATPGELAGGGGTRRVGGVVRGIGAVLLWGSLQALFLLVPPLAGVALNLALAGAFVWWFALRPAARADRRRLATLRLRPVRAGWGWVAAAALALVAFVLAGLVVLPRVLTVPAERVTFLDAYLRRPFGVAAVLVMVALIAPLLEEFLFRGWMQRTLERRTAPWQAIGVTALVFAAVHLEGYGFPLRLAFGLASGYAAWGSRSIWPSVVLHGAYNGSLVVVGSAVPSLDQRTLVAWAHTPSVFWPALLTMAAAGVAGAWALARLRRATRGARRSGAARR